jgi:hypothetical protein
VSEKDCTLFLFIFLKKVLSFSDTLYIGIINGFKHHGDRIRINIYNKNKFI